MLNTLHHQKPCNIPDGSDLSLNPWFLCVFQIFFCLPVQEVRLHLVTNRSAPRVAVTSAGTWTPEEHRHLSHLPVCIWNLCSNISSWPWYKLQFSVLVSLKFYLIFFSVPFYMKLQDLQKMLVKLSYLLIFPLSKMVKISCQNILSSSKFHKS